MADYVTAKRLDSLSDKALQKNFVEDVKYDKDLVTLMNSNVKRLSLWVLIICGIFTLIAVLLINSSIRLAVYSKRFSIKTMQMVGATKSFIRKWVKTTFGILQTRRLKKQPLSVGCMWGIGMGLKFYRLIL